MTIVRSWFVSCVVLLTGMLAASPGEVRAQAPIKIGLVQGLTGAELWAAEIRFLSQLPAKVESGDVLSVVAMGLILSFLATIYPAWRAARVDPVEALRYE